MYDRSRRRISLFLISSACLLSFSAVHGNSEINPENAGFEPTFPGGQSSVLAVLGQSPQREDPKTVKPTKSKSLELNGFKAQAQRALSKAGGGVVHVIKPKAPSPSPRSRKIPIDSQPQADVIEENLIGATFDAIDARSRLPTPTELSEVPIAGFPSQAKESPPPAILIESYSSLPGASKKLSINVHSGSQDSLLSGSTFISPIEYLTFNVIVSLCILVL